MIDTYILACMLKNDFSNVGTFNLVNVVTDKAHITT